MVGVNHSSHNELPRVLLARVIAKNASVDFQRHLF